MQSDQVSAAIWDQIPPPREGVNVTYYDDAIVWVGLNHTYADSQSLTHRWRSFIPWMSSASSAFFHLVARSNLPPPACPSFM
jgi:hypothetical protein